MLSNSNDKSEQEFRKALKRYDANLLIVYVTQKDQFAEKASAPLLVTYLTQKGYTWAQKNPSTMNRWLRQIAEFKDDWNGKQRAA